MTKYVKHLNRMAAERFDVLEGPPPPKGCNAKSSYGRRCGNRVDVRYPDHFGFRRLCSHHEAVYRKHDKAINFIRSIPPRNAI